MGKKKPSEQIRKAYRLNLMFYYASITEQEFLRNICIIGHQLAITVNTITAATNPNAKCTLNAKIANTAARIILTNLSLIPMFVLIVISLFLV